MIATESTAVYEVIVETNDNSKKAANPVFEGVGEKTRALAALRCDDLDLPLVLGTPSFE